MPGIDVSAELEADLRVLDERIVATRNRIARLEGSGHLEPDEIGALGRLDSVLARLMAARRGILAALARKASGGRLGGTIGEVTERLRVVRR